MRCYFLFANSIVLITVHQDVLHNPDFIGAQDLAEHRDLVIGRWHFVPPRFSDVPYYSTTIASYAHCYTRMHCWHWQSLGFFGCLVIRWQLLRFTTYTIFTSYKRRNTMAEIIRTKCHIGHLVITDTAVHIETKLMGQHNKMLSRASIIGVDMMPYPKLLGIGGKHADLTFHGPGGAITTKTVNIDVARQIVALVGF